LYFLVNTKMHEIYLSISVIFNQGKIRDTWQISRVLLCPLALALNEGLSR
jgi:hypothetical protein